MTPAEYIPKFKERHGRIPSQVELSKALGLGPETAMKALMVFSRGEPVQHSEPQHNVETRNVPQLLIVVGLLCISALTFVLSVYFTALWFTQMFSIGIAGVISVAMVSYMVLSPQAALFVRGVVKVPLWATFGIALVFSMGSTVAGQYNQLTESVDVTAVTDRALLELLREQEDDLRSGIEEMREQQRFHQDTLESLSQTAEDRKENSSYIWTERNKVAELRSAIDADQERLASVQAEIRAELAEGNIGATEERDDFYTWVGGIVGMERSRMEFLVSALPAVFIDIIAALSLNLALSMRRKRGQ